MAKAPKDGDKIDLTRKIEVFAPVEPPSKWEPRMTKSFTHLYGGGAPTPSPSVTELAAQYVREMYGAHAPEGSERFNELVKATEAQYMDALDNTKGM